MESPLGLELRVAHLERLTKLLITVLVVFATGVSAFFVVAATTNSQQDLVKTHRLLVTDSSNQPRVEITAATEDARIPSSGRITFRNPSGNVVGEYFESGFEVKSRDEAASLVGAQLSLATHSRGNILINAGRDKADISIQFQGNFVRIRAGNSQTSLVASDVSGCTAEIGKSKSEIGAPDGRCFRIR